MRKPPLDEEPRSISPANQPALNEVLQILCAQSDEMPTLCQQLRELQNDVSAMAAVRSVSPAPSGSSDRSDSSAKGHTQDPKITPPDLFYGKISEFQNFLAQCTLMLTLCSISYNSDYKRVFFVISNLRGVPLTWARKIISDEEHPLRNNYAAFIAALTNIYGDRAYELECEDKLSHLIQTGSAASYAQAFQSLATPLGIDDKSQCLMFYGGLNDKVKKAIIIAGRAKNIQSLINQAINFDQMLYQQTRRQRKREPQDDFPYPNRKRQNDHTTNKAPVPRSPTTSSPPRVPSPNARIPRFRPHLTLKQREHRRQNKLCAYCGDSEHEVGACHRAPKGDNIARPLANLSNPPSSSPLLYPVPVRPSSAPPNSENWKSQPSRM